MESVRKLNTAGRNSGLKINTKKTKTMAFGRQNIEKCIKVGSTTLENVEHFVYLDSVLTWDNDCTKDIRTRIVKAKAVMAGFNNIWRIKQMSYRINISILNTCAFSVALYACETRSLKKTRQATGI